MADANTVSSALATLGGGGWTPTNDPRYGGADVLWRSTWAGRPLTGTIPLGQRLLVTDLGISPGLEFRWDGTRWIPAGVQVLARSNAAASTTGDTNENTLASILVPGGVMGASGSLRITTLWTTTNNVNAKTARVKFGAMLVNQVSVASANGSQLLGMVRNRSVTSQIGAGAGHAGGFGQVTVAHPATGAENTANDVTLAITYQNGVGTDTGTLESHIAELIP